ncbi:MAG: DNA repair protein RecO [Firmicutes bacterium]|nr:DNA repair protein RecO [Bacillota bacterium]
MSVIKARGVVIREQDTGEAGKVLTLLLKERGKATVSARGARRQNSKIMAGAQLFTYSDFVFFQKGDFLSLTQADVIESFYGLREDYDRFCAGACLLELCDLAILENAPCDDVLWLLLKTLLALSRGKISTDYAARAFEFKFLAYMGIAPDFDSCAYCGGKINQTDGDGASPTAANGAVLFGGGGTVCAKCAASGAGAEDIKRLMRLSREAVETAKQFSAAPVEKLFAFREPPPDWVLAQLERAAGIFLRTHFDYKRRLKTKEL